MHQKNGYPAVVRFGKNDLGRDYVIGDIHGSFNMVLSAMEKAGFNKKTDRLFCVGDLIDRGNGSHRVSRFLSQPYVFSVMGNHEALLLELYKDGTPDNRVLEYFYRTNGLSWWGSVDEANRREILDAISKLPYVIEVETDRGVVGLLHAEVPQGMNWSDFIFHINDGNDVVINSCLEGRKRLKNGDDSFVDGVGRIFVGHTPQWEALRKLGNIYAVDTGAVYIDAGLRDKGHMTMVDVACKTDYLTCPKKLDSVIDIRISEPEMKPFSV